MNVMTEQIRRVLRDSKAARWTALFLVSFSMFAGYYLADVLAPLKGLLENELTWNSSEYGFFTSAYGWFNVFLFFLIIGGIILDKKGIRFTGLTAAIIMIVGTALKYWAISTHALDGVSWYVPILGTWKAQVMLAATGYAIFGVGVEIVGITATKVIVKWFKGKELALAMGLQLALARLGTALALSTSLPIARAFGHVSAPVLICLIMLCIGFMAFLMYTFMDKKLDASIVADNVGKDVAPEEEFRMKDIWGIVKNKGWWYIAILCVLFYSAVFPFLKYATDLMIQKFHINDYWAGTLPSLLPFGTILLTPFFGNLYDRKGKGATIMIIGSFIIILVHLLFAVPFLNHWIVALLLILLLGIGFSLVPSAMWPSVPKIIPERQLGTAYSLIFWVQNWGLMGVPALIGWVVNKYCFIGYFSLMGTGFITTQGDQVSKVVTQDKQVFELSEVGFFGRIDTTLQVLQFIKTPAGDVSAVVASNGDTIGRNFISDDAFVDVLAKKEVQIPIYSYMVTDPQTKKEKKCAVDHFIDAKGSSVERYYNITSFYNYTLPMLIFMGFGLLAILFAFLLRIEDKKKGYGLQLPNIKK
jgi:predicted MFS family arabinose efflux permease